jgi:hypothetical protein
MNTELILAFIAGIVFALCAVFVVCRLFDKAALILVLAAFGICFAASAQTSALTNLTVVPPQVTTNSPVTVASGINTILAAVEAGETNWFVIPYGLYAPGLSHRFGGGIAGMYPLSQYVITGIRLDWVNGGFWMPSGNATIQLPVKVFSWLTVVPFTFAGVGVPVSGATVGSVTVPGSVPRDNNGQPTAILGYGGAIKVYSGSGFIKNVDIVGDSETWTGFAGQQYRFGAALKF